MKRIALFFIKAYRLCIRPCVGSCCRFYPSCSEYGLEAFQKKPFLTALFLVFKRISKCHPWHPGGFDPLS